MACSAEGFDVDVVHDGLDGLWRAREGDVRRDRARHPAARDERLPGVPDACARKASGRRSSCSPPRTASTTRPRRSTPAPTTSSRSRSRSWCSSRACARSLRRAGRAPAARAPGRLPRARRRRPRHCARDDERDHADAPRVLAARALMRRAGRGRAEARAPRRRRGAPTSPATPTSSRCTSGTCAARSTSRSAPAHSRPCAASATGRCPRSRPRPVSRVFGSVRVRITLAATVVFAIASVARRGRHGRVRPPLARGRVPATTGVTVVNEVAGQLQRAPTRSTCRAPGTSDPPFVVLDSAGNPVAGPTRSSRCRSRVPAIAADGPATGGGARHHLRATHRERLRPVTWRSVQSNGQGFTVAAASPLDAVRRSVDTLARRAVARPAHARRRGRPARVVPRRAGAPAGRGDPHRGRGDQPHDDAPPGAASRPGRATRSRGSRTR